MPLSHQEIENFQEVIWDYYAKHGRTTLQWRLPEPDDSFDPYKIMVSELMLQQTQVARVIPKYEAFLESFPNVQSLAAATLGDVLRTWQGLGYNRRAKFLWMAAAAITKMDTFPKSLEALVKLPGIGKNTAGAILAYAFNQPVVFIETNIRTVYIHHFFPNENEVTDKQIVELVEQTLPHDEEKEHPESRIHFDPGAMRKTVGLSHYREWYWALMDYGSYLKQTIGNPNKASKHFAKQSTFHGSKRQIRGHIIRLLGTGRYSFEELQKTIRDERLKAVLVELVNERLIKERSGTYSLD